MNPDEEIFEAAAALPEAERAAYLDQACSGHPAMRDRIEALLRSHEVSGFMEAGTSGGGLPPPPGSHRAGNSFDGRILTATSEQSGERIGRYRLLQQIGEGGFGTVWMAEQIEPVTRRVALKIIKAGMDTKEVIARFEAERQALAMMDHPNIARVFDAGATDKGRPYFVMELVKGIPITKFCDEQQFTTRQRLELFTEVCSAINHAHQKGVIHRDIKPSNVMVTLHGDKPVPKVIDFGIAKAIEGRLTDKTLFTQFEQFIGTPAYMSPEQTAVSGLDVDTRSDIYSLGILLFELLTGKPPFDAKSLLSAGHAEMRRIICEVEPPKPSTRLSTAAGEERTALAKARQVVPEKLNRVVEPDLDWIVMKAIEKDRTRRYETANGLALDIQRFLSNESVSATPPSAGYRFRKFARRNRIALRVAALLVLATIVSTWQAIRASSGQREAKKQTERAEGEKAVANAATEQLRAKVREAAQSHRFAARVLAAQGRYRDALVRLAQACDYAPESTAAAEQAVALGNEANLSLPIATLTGHEGSVNSAQFRPDGLWIVTASSDTTARVWEANSGRLVRTLSGHKGLVRSAHFSPDGARIVTASEDNTAILWEAATGRQIATLSGHRDSLRGARFSADGSRVVTISDDETARVWDGRSGALIATLSGNEGLLETGRFSPDGARVVTGSADGAVRVWGASTGRSLTKLEGHTGRISSAAFSLDGSRIVTASWDKKGRVWDADTGKHIATLSGHTHSLKSAEFSPDGTRIVTSSDDRSGQVWEAATGRLIATLSHQDRLKSAEFSPDGRRIVTGSDDKTARIWEAATGRLVSTLGGHRGRVWSTQFSPDGTRVVTASADGTARVWDMSTSRPSAILSGHQHRVWNAQFSRDGARIVTNSDDQTARVWDAASGQPLAILTGHRKRVWTAQFSPDGTRVVTASLDKTARLWDATTGLPIATLAGHQAGVGSAQFSPDGSRIVTASDDKTARIWDASTGRLIRPLSGHGSFVWNAQFSPDGTRVVTSSDDLTAKVWEAASGRLITTLSGWKDEVWILQFSPDGARIATASYDGTARVWDAVTGQPILTLPEMPPNVRSIQFSPDGARLATASEDKLVRLWDAATGAPLATLSGHRDRARNAQFSRDGKRLVSNCWENVFVWDAITGQRIVSLTEFHDPAHRSKRSFDGARNESAKGVSLIIEDFGEDIPANAPLHAHRQRINIAQFSPDADRIVTASDDKTARVWELLGTHEPLPPWFSDFLRVISLGRLDANGELEDLPVDVWLNRRTEILGAMKSDTTRYGDIARYYLTPGPDRPVRPGARITCREAADSLTSPEATSPQLERAYALDPAHPLIQLALARFTEDGAGAEFLRRYGLGKISPAAPILILQRAAALLAVQPGQEAKELELIERVEASADGVTLAQARRRKMILLTVLGRFEEARAVDAELASSAPELRRAALPEAALIASRAGRAQEATAWIEEAVRIGPGDERVHRISGWCWLILGKNENALQHFTAGFPGDGGDQPASDAAREIDRKLGLSLALTTAGRLAEALEIFRPLAAEYPSLLNPDLPQQLKWGPVEGKWLADLQIRLKATAASPGSETQQNRGLMQTLLDYDAGPLGHP